MPIGINKILSSGGGGSSASRITVYDEGNDCRDFLANWNYNETSNMSVSPVPNGYDGGSGYWHGWGGSGRTYTLTKGDLPSHQFLCYDCIIHHVDSWDNEYQHMNIDGVRFASWRKIWNENRFRELVGNHDSSETGGATLLARFNNDYSYEPWNGSNDSTMGYIRFSSGWIPHTASSVTVDHRTDLNQGRGDEAYYISHARIRVVNASALDFGTGASPASAMESGHQGMINGRITTSGLYWIQSHSMPSPLQMYVDATEDGGGYDFYPINGSGTNVNYHGQNHSGVDLGLDMFYGRSKYAWRAAANYATSVNGGNWPNFFTGCGDVYKTGGGGNYTGRIMRSSDYGGNNTHDWRVTDGGKWWLRDNTHSEPNGDYSADGYLNMYGGSRNNLKNLSNIGFNDGGAYSIGNYYLLSTNQHNFE